MNWKILLIGVLVCGTASVSKSQGFLPPETTSTTTTPSTGSPEVMRIGSWFPKTYMVTNMDGQQRSLISYKSALDVMVILFLSPNCDAKQQHWPLIKHLYEDYNGWHVAFVAINTGDPASSGTLAEQLKKNKMGKVPLLQDDDHAVTKAFAISGAPEFAMLDESAVLQYRGPPGKYARSALVAMIGHTSKVPNPEPVEILGCPVP